MRGRYGALQQHTKEAPSSSINIYQGYRLLEAVYFQRPLQYPNDVLPLFALGVQNRCGGESRLPVRIESARRGVVERQAFTSSRAEGEHDSGG